MRHRSPREFARTLLFIALGGISLAAWQPPVQPEQADSPSASLLKQLGDEYSTLRLGDERLTDVSFARTQRAGDEAQSMLVRLGKVRPAELTHEDWITRAILQRQLEQTVDEVETYWYQFSVTAQANVFLSTNRVFERHPLNTAPDLAAYQVRLGEYPEFVSRMQAKLAGQAERGILLPEAALGPVVTTIRQYVRNPPNSPFSVAAPRLSRIEAGAAEMFQQQVSRVIAADLNPALLRLAAYLDGDLRGRAPKTIGIGQYPGGPNAYARLIRRETTLPVTPQEAHLIGLKEVERLEQEMSKVRSRLGFEGSKADFHRVLRNDPRFIPKTPDEIHDRLVQAVDRITPKLGQYFLSFPKSPWAIRRLNPALEESMTFGYYTIPTAVDPSGYYYFNGSDLSQRSLLNSASLAFHEIMPGHHLQRALQVESVGRPEFRRRLGIAGFNEGWAEYASSGIALEAGMYSDPYDLYGRLGWDTLFSARLVVDSGLNFYGWSRERAIAYMKEHTLESDAQIDSETLRYGVGSPAQALAYKLGSLKMFELRRRAERMLGSRFELRKFHEALIGSGPMPLPTLSEHIDWYIARELTHIPGSPRPSIE